MWVRVCASQLLLATCTSRGLEQEEEEEEEGDKRTHACIMAPAWPGREREWGGGE